jgi:hypothetical protein
MYGAIALAVTTASFVAGASSQVIAVARVADVPTIEVSLGVHQFGKLIAPSAVVARVGADGVGWVQPGPGTRFSAGIQRGPSSFEVAPDGTVWLLDQENSRLLGWPPGRPDRPTLTVPLPFVPDAFALGPNGTFYATEYTPGTNILRSVAADGRVLWQAPLAVMNVSGVRLHRAPGGVLYAILSEWTPVTTAAGTPLPLDQQRPLSANHQPLPDGGQLVLTVQSARELTVSRVERTGQPVRTWRITSGTDIGMQENVRPALVGDDPVVTLYAYDARFGPSETLALRLTASGAQPRLHLKSAIWGEPPAAEFQAGPGQSYYQLQTSRTTGVKIVRYTLAGAAPTPTTAGGTAVPVPTPSPAQSTPTLAPTPTAQPSATESTSRSWLPWVGGITLTVLAAFSAGLLIRRRRHQAPTTPSEHAVPDQPLDLTSPRRP